MTTVRIKTGSMCVLYGATKEHTVCCLVHKELNILFITTYKVNIDQNNRELIVGKHSVTVPLYIDEHGLCDNRNYKLSKA